MNGSLPPTERGKARYMLLQILFPSQLKDKQQKKYYNFMAKFELNELFHQGVAGIRVKIFCTSMDTPGRAELMGNYIFFIVFFFIVSIAFF